MTLMCSRPLKHVKIDPLWVITMNIQYRLSNPSQLVKVRICITQDPRLWIPNAKCDFQLSSINMKSQAQTADVIANNSVRDVISRWLARGLLHRTDWVPNGQWKKIVVSRPDSSVRPVRVYFCLSLYCEYTDLPIILFDSLKYSPYRWTRLKTTWDCARFYN